MKTLKEIEKWAEKDLAPVLLKKFEDGDFDHLGINGSKTKSGKDYFEEVRLLDVLPIKEFNSLEVNMVPRGAGTRGFGGYYHAVITIHLCREPKKKYTYCCEKKHHITHEEYFYYPTPDKDMMKAVMMGLGKSILKTSIKEIWNDNSRGYDGGTVSVAVNVLCKEWHQYCEKHREKW